MEKKRPKRGYKRIKQIECNALIFRQLYLTTQNFRSFKFDSFGVFLYRIWVSEGRDTRFDFLSASFKMGQDKISRFDPFSSLFRGSATARIQTLKEPYHADSESRKANKSDFLE